MWLCCYQVAELMKQVVELGGKLTRDRPISPPPLPEPSDNIPVSLIYKLLNDLLHNDYHITVREYGCQKMC